jgi:hypothetical protein
MENARDTIPFRCKSQETFLASADMPTVVGACTEPYSAKQNVSVFDD